MVVYHTVLFGFKEDTDETQVQACVADLNLLPAAIPEVQSWAVAEDIGKRDGSLRFALLATFADMAALERYLTHPEHVRVVSNALPYLSSLAEHDYLG